MNMLRKRDNCRLCGSKELQLIYKMPECPPVDNFRRPGDPEISLPNFPMDLYMCRACGHAQLLDVVDPEILYGNYIYTSGSSTDLDRHFSEYADRMAVYFGLRENAKVLDIGSNDGLLLSKFKGKGLNVLGVDPSDYVASRALERGIQTIVGYFSDSCAKQLAAEFGLFDLVTANNVFSHADNLREFAESARLVLSDTGAFVFEVSYLKDLVDNLVIDYVYHEHLCHHSVKPLQQFLMSCGFRLINVERMKTKGGSIRCYAVKLGSAMPVEPAVDHMIKNEVTSGLYDLRTYENLRKKIEAASLSLKVVLDDVLGRGGKMATYGASATSTVLNAILGINQRISFIVDDNPLRQNRLSPGFMAPILGSSALKEYRPACVVVSAWRFASEIIARNQDYLAAGGKFIVPLPELKVVKK